MRSPFAPLHLLIILAFLIGLILSVKLGLITLTFRRLGLDPQSALSLLLISLAGSLINLPLFSMRAARPSEPWGSEFYGLLRVPRPVFTGRTQVAVNVGGGLVPVLFSFYLLRNHALPMSQVVSGVGIVALVSYGLSRPVPGIGIGMPVLVAPLTAAAIAILIGGENRAPLAYVSGSLGVLIGADLLRLPDIGKMGAPMASIGGAGTFDGIFMTGLVAVLLT